MVSTYRTFAIKITGTQRVPVIFMAWNGMRKAGPGTAGVKNLSGGQVFQTLGASPETGRQSGGLADGFRNGYNGREAKMQVSPIIHPPKCHSSPRFLNFS